MSELTGHFVEADSPRRKYAKNLEGLKKGKIVEEPDDDPDRERRGQINKKTTTYTDVSDEDLPGKTAELLERMFGATDAISIQTKLIEWKVDYDIKYFSRQK